MTTIILGLYNRTFPILYTHCDNDASTLRTVTHLLINHPQRINHPDIKPLIKAKLSMYKPTPENKPSLPISTPMEGNSCSLL
jgi:hypothetical protein